MRALRLPNYDNDDDKDDDVVDDNNKKNKISEFFFSNKKIKKKLGTFSKKLLKIGELLSEFKTWPLKALNLLFVIFFIIITKSILNVTISIFKV